MPKAFIAACAQYFGRQPNQSLSDFKAECDRLTDADKAELAPLLSAAIGEEVIAVKPASA